VIWYSIGSISRRGGQLAGSDRKSAAAKPYRTGQARVLLLRLALHTENVKDVSSK
jgi:hypothetical protein